MNWEKEREEFIVRMQKEAEEIWNREHEAIMKRANRLYPMTTDEAYPPGKDEVDQPKTHYDIDRSVSIEYFLKGVSQAKLLICKGSNQADRERLAKENGVLEFDQFRLDGVRVIASLTDQNGFIDDHGRLWIVENNS